MKIFVTGAKGFIGSHLVAKLHSQGYHVVPFDIDVGDITDARTLDQYLKEDFTHVFHLAGKTFVPDSWKDPHAFFKINVGGTLNVLEFCRKTKATLILLSSYLYGEPQYLPIDEKHPLNAFNPYGQSKLMAEELSRYYTTTFHVRSFIFRLFNVYGPGQSGAFLIPEIITKIRSGEDTSIQLQDLRPRRDYVYIDDVIEALILALDGNPGIYNVGSGVSFSVKEIVEFLVRIENSSKPILDLYEERPNDVLDLYADIGLIKQELGWEPRTGFFQGLKKCLNDNDR